MSENDTNDQDESFMYDSYENIRAKIEEGRNLSSCDRYGCVPLHYAVQNPDPKVVELILRKYSNISPLDHDGKSPLHYACQEGRFSTCKFLIHSGADAKKPDCNGVTPLHCAALQDDTNIVQLLIDQGADIRAKGDVFGKTPLWIALENGNLEVAQLLINQGASLHERDDVGRLVIHSIISEDNGSVLKFLLDRGVDVNVRTRDGYTPFFRACLFGTFDTVMKLVEEGAKINPISDNKEIPLHFASEMSRRRVIDFLLRKKSMVDVVDTYGDTPLKEVCMCVIENDPERHVDAARKLLEWGASAQHKKSDNSTLVHFSTCGGSPELVELLLSYGANPNAVNDAAETALTNACEKRNWDVAKFLLSKMERPLLDEETYSGQSALSFAIQGRNNEIVEKLISRGVDLSNSVLDACISGDVRFVKYFIELGIGPTTPGKRNTLPINLAAAEGRTNVVEYLLLNGCSINSKNALQETPLHSAISVDTNYSMVEFLLKNGADVTARNIDGKIPLHLGVSSSYYTDLLIKYKSDIDSCDNNNNTPFHFACAHGDLETITLLVNAGANIFALDNLEKSGAHFAAENGHDDTLKYLVQLSLDINSMSSEHGAPLHHAAINDHENVIEYLLNDGVDIDLKNNNGQTALHCAVDKDSKTTVEFILQRGANVNVASNDGVMPLHLAVELNSTRMNILDSLLEKKASTEAVDHKGETILHHACQFSDTKMIERLLELGSDLNRTDNSGRNVLHFAGMSGSIDLVKFFFHRDPALNCPDKNGYRPIFYCAHRLAGEFLLPVTADIKPEELNSLICTDSWDNSTPKLLRKLIKLGANVRVTDENGNTPLHYAARFGCVKSIKILLASGSDVNAANKEHQTPLYFAITSNNLDALKMLFSANPNLNLEDFKGRTPLEYAKQVKPKFLKYLTTRITI